jgi:hypothetical protein
MTQALASPPEHSGACNNHSSGQAASSDPGAVLYGARVIVADQTRWRTIGHRMTPDFGKRGPLIGEGTDISKEQAYARSG